MTKQWGDELGMDYVAPEPDPVPEWIADGTYTYKPTENFTMGDIFRANPNDLKNIAAKAQVKLYGLVRDKHGRPKVDVDDPKDLPEQIQQMLTTSLLVIDQNIYFDLASFALLSHMQI